MNRKGVELLTGNIVMILFVAVIIGLFFAAIWQHKNNSSFWEGYYAKEIAGVIDSSNAGDEITIDLSYASKIAQKNGKTEFGDIVRFDSAEKEVIVSFKKGSYTYFEYFNDVIIAEPKIKLGEESNILTFKIAGGENE